MWRVTLNCLGSQTLSLSTRLLPGPLRFPTKAHTSLNQPSVCSFLAAGHLASAASPNAVPSSPRSLNLRRGRCGTAGPSQGTRRGRDVAARLHRPAPSSPPLLSQGPVPPLPGRCAEWHPHRLELVSVRSQPVRPRF